MNLIEYKTNTIQQSKEFCKCASKAYISQYFNNCENLKVIFSNNFDNEFLEAIFTNLLSQLSNFISRYKMPTLWETIVNEFDINATELIKKMQNIMCPIIDSDKEEINNNNNQKNVPKKKIK